MKMWKTFIIVLLEINIMIFLYQIEKKHAINFQKCFCKIDSSLF